MEFIDIKLESDDKAYTIHIHSSNSWFDSELAKMALPAEMDFEYCRLQHTWVEYPALVKSWTHWLLELRKSKHFGELTSAGL